MTTGASEASEVTAHPSGLLPLLLHPLLWILASARATAGALATSEVAPPLLRIPPPLPLLSFSNLPCSFLSSFPSAFDNDTESVPFLLPSPVSYSICQPLTSLITLAAPVTSGQPLPIGGVHRLMTFQVQVPLTSQVANAFCPAARVAPPRRRKLK